jgi:hypothetical protein
MTEPMGVEAEAWALAADATPDPKTGRPGTIWLLPADRVGPTVTYSTGDPWDTAKLDLAGLGIVDPTDDNYVQVPGRLNDLVFLHGTSGRPDRYRYIVTHMAVVEVAAEFVRELWPQALPVTDELLKYAGKPYPHGPTTAPVPRDIDVLWHGIGHLAYLRDYSSEFAEVLTSKPSGRWWLAALEPLAPLLAKQYRRDERAAWLAAVEHSAA